MNMIDKFLKVGVSSVNTDNKKEGGSVSRDSKEVRMHMEKRIDAGREFCLHLSSFLVSVL